MKKIIEFNDLVKANQQLLYVTIPKEEAEKIGLKKKDAVKITLEKLGGS